MLKVEGIYKNFDTLCANKNISFELGKGEVLAVLGENGAGKTTLMRIIYGLETADAGTIYIDGKKVRIGSAKESIKLGIGMVHQHFKLINNFTVTENLILGMKETKGAVVNLKKMDKEIQVFFKQYRFDIETNKKVGTLPVGLQQRVEIMKALFHGAEIMVFDEPTAVLSPHEIRELFHIIRQLTNEGKSIIFISHKLDEVMEISDRIMVLRLGEIRGFFQSKSCTKEELINKMIGRNLVTLNKKKAPENLERKKLLEVRNLIVHAGKKRVVKGLNFAVYNHEIVGIAGVDGNGQKELIEAITGLLTITSGEVHICGKRIEKMDPKRIRDMGLSHIPENRRTMGVVLSLSIKDNAIMVDFDKEPFSKKFILREKEAVRYSEKLVDKYRIAVHNIHDNVSSLSGGNQQKLVVAREIETKPEVLIAVKPTRGVDVGALEYIHQCLLEEREQGKAILLVSSELEEIMTLSDRIAVMHNGEIMGIVNAEDTDEDELGALMTGMRKGRD